MKTVITLTLLLLLASAAQAASPREEAARFEALLNAIDVVPPDRAALEALAPDVWQRLDAAARDEQRTTWTRLRALSLLSYFPEERTQLTLVALAGAQDVEVRGQAVYALGRTFGARADARLVRVIAAHVADPERFAVAQQAVRALRWVDDAAAQAVLEATTTSGPAKLRALARTTLDRRTARLHEQR